MFHKVIITLLKPYPPPGSSGYVYDIFFFGAERYGVG